MPTAIDDLQPGASEGQGKAALSDCIATEVRAGKSQEEATAMCIQMLKDKMQPSAPQGGA